MSGIGRQVWIIGVQGTTTVILRGSFSLDPKAKDYPRLSDYSYVAGNPLIFIDSDGRDIIIYDDESNKVATVSKNGIVVEEGMESSPILQYFQAALEYLQGNDDGTFDELMDSERITYLFEDNTDGTGALFIPNSEDPEGNEVGGIIWNPKEGAIDAEGNAHFPAMILFHEAAHAAHSLNDPAQMLIDKTTFIPDYDNMEEKRQ